MESINFMKLEPSISYHCQDGGGYERDNYKKLNLNPTEPNCLNHLAV